MDYAQGTLLPCPALVITDPANPRKECHSPDYLLQVCDDDSMSLGNGIHYSEVIYADQMNSLSVTSRRTLGSGPNFATCRFSRKGRGIDAFCWVLCR